jgi:type IV pilus assembly protein PilN
MAKINLLPWRDERRKERNREAQITFFLTALLAVAAVFLVCYQYAGLIEDQNGRNAFVEGKIAEVDKLIIEVESYEKERSKLVAQIKVYEELQLNRSAVVQLLNNLIETVPDGVRLSSIKQTGEQLTLEGFAESEDRVGDYMRRVEGKKDYFDVPELQIVELKEGQVDKRAPRAFVLKVNLKKSKKDEGAQPEQNAAVKAQGAA